MAPGALPTPMRIECCGALARRILAGQGEVQVVAVMARSVYLAIGDDLVCIGDASIGNGPINVTLLASNAAGWLRLETGMRGHLASGVCRIGSHIAVDTRSGHTWTPLPLPPFSPERVARGLERLRVSADGQVPSDGLAGHVLAQSNTANRDALARLAAGPIADLAAGLSDALAGTWTTRTLEATLALVGLGPGLTPSGDDLLGGLMLALLAGGRADLRDQLWQRVSPQLGALTSPISLMHLRAASQGMVSAPLHDLVDALMRGDEAAIGDHLAAVAAIGHTSGWDALAGIVLGLEALANAAER